MLEAMRQMIKLAEQGKSLNEIAAAGDSTTEMASVAYAALRKHELPVRETFKETIYDKIRDWPKRNQEIVELSLSGSFTQKEIAQKVNCSQATVAYTLKKLVSAQEEIKRETSKAIPSQYQTRIHLYLHRFEDWEKIRRIDFGNEIDIQKKIDEVIAISSSEMLLLKASYDPFQLDKLIMDIILATNGCCAVIADTYDVTATEPTHIVYYLRDCIHTKELYRSRNDRGWDIAMGAKIQFMEDWFDYLKIPLSANDTEKLQTVNFWRY